MAKKKLSISESEQKQYREKQEARGLSDYVPDGQPLDPDAPAHSNQAGAQVEKRAARGAKKKAAVKAPAKKNKKKK